MAERATIQAEIRSVLGKQCNQLRRQGILPANVYGRDVESQAVQLNARDFARHVKAHGIRTMFLLNVAGEKAPRHVVIRGLTRKGGTGDFHHIDFLHVDPERPIVSNVPLRLVGDAPAVRDLAGTLLPSLEVVAVRCRPMDIPDAIEADIALLTGFDVSMKVSDITPPAGIEIVTDPRIIVATVNRPRVRAAAQGR